EDLAVDDAGRGQVVPEGVGQLGEVAGHRPLVAAAELDLASIPIDHAAEAVPLGFVEQAIARGQVAGQLGQHGLDRRPDGQVLHAGHAWLAAHATSSSAPQALTIDSTGTSQSAARAQPYTCHSS